MLIQVSERDPKMPPSIIGIDALLCWVWSDHRDTQIAKFMGPTWGPSGSCRPHMGPMLAPWTSLSGQLRITMTMCEWCGDSTYSQHWGSHATLRNMVRWQVHCGSIIIVFLATFWWLSSWRRAHCCYGLCIIMVMVRRFQECNWKSKNTSHSQLPIEDM